MHAANWSDFPACCGCHRRSLSVGVRSLQGENYYFLPLDAAFKHFYSLDLKNTASRALFVGISRSTLTQCNSHIPRFHFEGITAPSPGVSMLVLNPWVLFYVCLASTRHAVASLPELVIPQWFLMCFLKKKKKKKTSSNQTQCLQSQFRNQVIL